jgi:hypothetical protein
MDGDWPLRHRPLLSQELGERSAETAASTASATRLRRVGCVLVFDWLDADQVRLGDGLLASRRRRSASSLAIRPTRSASWKKQSCSFEKRLADGLWVTARVARLVCQWPSSDTGWYAHVD